MGYLERPVYRLDHYAEYRILEKARVFEAGIYRRLGLGHSWLLAPRWALIMEIVAYEIRALRLIPLTHWHQVIPPLFIGGKVPAPKRLNWVLQREFFSKLFSFHTLTQMSKIACSHYYKLGAKAGLQCDKNVSKVDPAGKYCSSHYKKAPKQDDPSAPRKAPKKQLELIPDYDEDEQHLPHPGFPEPRSPQHKEPEEDSGSDGYEPASPQSDLDSDATLAMLINELKLIAKCKDVGKMRKGILEIIAMA